MTLSSNHSYLVRAIRTTSKRRRNERRENIPKSAGNQASVLDFVEAMGESVCHLKKRDIARYTDWRLLALSAKWSKAVGMESGEDEGSASWGVGVEKWAASLSAECARLEVDGLSLMASLNVDAEPNLQNGVFDNEDDDGLSEEMESLSVDVGELQETLGRIDEAERSRRRAVEMEYAYKMKDQDVAGRRLDAHGFAEKQRVLAVPMAVRGLRARSLGRVGASHQRRQ